MASEDIKKISTQAVIEITGTGLETIELRELATASERFDSANANVSIARVIYSLSGDSIIERGGNVVLSLSSGEYDFDFAHSTGSIQENNNDDINVTLTDESDYVILFLDKEQGYREKQIGPNVVLELNEVLDTFDVPWLYLTSDDGYIFQDIVSVREDVDIQKVGNLVADIEDTFFLNDDELTHSSIFNRLISLDSVNTEDEFAITDIILGLSIDDIVITDDEFLHNKTDKELSIDDDFSIEDDIELVHQDGNELSIDDSINSDDVFGTHVAFNIEQDDIATIDDEIQLGGFVHDLDFEDFYSITDEYEILKIKNVNIEDDYSEIAEIFELVVFGGGNVEFDDSFSIDDDIHLDHVKDRVIDIIENVVIEDDFIKVSEHEHDIDDLFFADDIISNQPSLSVSDSISEFEDLVNKEPNHTSIEDIPTDDIIFYISEFVNNISDDVPIEDWIRFPITVNELVEDAFDITDFQNYEADKEFLDDVDKVDDDQDDIIDDGNHGITVVLNDSAYTYEGLVYDIGFYSYIETFEPEDWIRFPITVNQEIDDEFISDDMVSNQPSPSVSDILSEFEDSDYQNEITASPSDSVFGDEEFEYVQNMVRQIEESFDEFEDWIRFPTTYLVDEEENIELDDFQFSIIDPNITDISEFDDSTISFVNDFNISGNVEIDEEIYRQVDFFRDQTDFLKKGDGVYFEEDYVLSSEYYTSEDAFDDVIIRAITHNREYQDELDLSDNISNQPSTEQKDYSETNDEWDKESSVINIDMFDTDDSDFEWFLSVPEVLDFDENVIIDDEIFFPIEYTSELEDDVNSQDSLITEAKKELLDDVDKVDDDQDDIIDDGDNGITIVINETVPCDDPILTDTVYERIIEDEYSNIDDEIFFPIHYQQESEDALSTEDEYETIFDLQSIDFVDIEEYQIDILPVKEESDLIETLVSHEFEFNQSTTEFLKKGDGVYFQEDYIIPGQEYVSEEVFQEIISNNGLKSIEDTTNEFEELISYSKSWEDENGLWIEIQDNNILYYNEEFDAKKFFIIDDTSIVDDTFTSEHLAFHGIDDYVSIDDIFSTIRNIDIDEITEVVDFQESGIIKSTIDVSNIDDRISLLFLRLEENIVSVDDLDFSIWEENNFSIINDYTADDFVFVESSTVTTDTVETQEEISFQLERHDTDTVSSEDEISYQSISFREFDDVIDIGDDTESIVNIDKEDSQEIDDVISSSLVIPVELQDDLSPIEESLESNFYQTSNDNVIAIDDGFTKDITPEIADDVVAEPSLNMNENNFQEINEIIELIDELIMTVSTSLHDEFDTDDQILPSLHVGINDYVSLEEEVVNLINKLGEEPVSVDDRISLLFLKIEENIVLIDDLDFSAWEDNNFSVINDYGAEDSILTESSPTMTDSIDIQEEIFVQIGKNDSDAISAEDEFIPMTYIHDDYVNVEEDSVNYSSIMDWVIDDYVVPMEDEIEFS